MKINEDETVDKSIDFAGELKNNISKKRGFFVSWFCRSSGPQSENKKNAKR